MGLAPISVLLAFVATKEFDGMEPSPVQLLALGAMAFLNLGVSMFLVSLPFFAVFVGAAAIDALLKQQQKTSSLIYQEEMTAPIQLIVMGYTVAAVNDGFVYELFQLMSGAVRDALAVAFASDQSHLSKGPLIGDHVAATALRHAAMIALPPCIAIASIEIALTQLDQQGNLFRLTELSSGFQLLMFLLLLQAVIDLGLLQPVFE